MSTTENPTVLMTAQQAADALNVSRSHMLKMARENEIPAIKLGHTWRFHREAIERIIADGLPSQ